MGKRLFRPPATTRIERGLMASMIILFPLEGNFVVAGYTLTFILFGLLTAFAVVRHPVTLLRTAFHPVFLIMYLFLITSLAVESLHLNSNYDVIRRTAQSFLGAIVLASYCRDPRALRIAIYSFLIMGGGMAIYLLLTVFGVLSVAVAPDLGTASMIRYSAFEGQYLRINLNGMAYLVGLGATVSLVLWVTSQKISRRAFLMTAFLVCFTAAFLPMSRSGIFIVVVLCVSVLFLSGQFRLRTLILGLFVALVILLVIPDVVFSRMSFTLEPMAVTGRPEGRAQVLLAAIGAVAEEPLIGVGTGNFRGAWGLWSDFYSPITGTISGAHNVLAQIIIYWGIMPCIIWMFMFLVLYRRLPQPFGANRVSLFLFALFVWILLMSMFGHTTYNKSYTLAMGTIIGFDQWIRSSIDWKSLR